MGQTTTTTCDLVAHVGGRTIDNSEVAKAFGWSRADGKPFVACGVCMGNRDPVFSAAVVAELTAMQAADWAVRGTTEAARLLDAIDSHRAGLRKMGAVKA